VSRRRNLHCRNWTRYLYLSMRSAERMFERQRRWFATYGSGSDLSRASHARLQVTLLRGADQSWRFLQEKR
jgi:hypothetical protein